MKLRTISNFFIVLAVICTFYAQGFAISEKNFNSNYQTTVMPEYQKGEFSSFTGVDGIKIAYAKFDRLNANSQGNNAFKGAIVIQHGDTESYRKYAELIYDLRELREEGYQIFLMDLRGQGYSERMLLNKYKDYVEEFDDYIADYSYFVKNIVSADNPPQIFAIAHSLGGCVTFRFIEENPSFFDAAVLCSPMMKPKTGAVGEDAALALAESAVNLGLGKLYAMGESLLGETLGPKNKPLFPAKFDGNTITTSETRWTKWNDVIQENNNELDVNGHTFNWVYQAITGARIARDLSYASRIKTPLVFFESENDLIVDTSVYQGINDAVNSAGGSSRLIKFGNASMHELYMEKDITRDNVVKETISFIRSHMK